MDLTSRAAASSVREGSPAPRGDVKGWRALVALALVLGCSDAATFPEDCAGLEPRDALACGELRFWEAHTVAYERRPQTYDLLARLIDEVPEGVDDAALGELRFRRASLGIELALEHGIDRTSEIVPDLREAIRLAPDNPKLPPWLDSMELVVSFVRGDRETFDAVSARIDANVAPYPVGNVLSITGTMTGLPLDTGLPQRAVAMLEAWECTEEWCRRNTARAPYSQPGLQVHFADAYARVGDRDAARAYLEAALVAEGAETWPYRAWARAQLANVDAWVDEFEALGDEGSAVTLVYANSERGCTLCHGTR